MTYNRNQARPLLTSAEFELFASSLAEQVSELDRRALTRAIGRARKARDKYRDLAKRQNLSVAKRAGARAAAHTANQRTDAKASIFGETLARFEKRVEKLDAAEARSVRKVAPAGAGKVAPAGAGKVAPSVPNRAARRAAARSGGATQAGSATKTGGATRSRGGTGTFMSDAAVGSNQEAIRAPQHRIVASRAAAGRRKQAKRDR